MGQSAGNSDYISRHLQESLDLALSDTPVVCLLGPRQCGKSTLAKHQAPDRVFISLDDARYLDLARADPMGLVSELPGFVTIDEIQRAPELILAIKHSVDLDRRPGRFLLTGSANLLQLPRLADSLAGRMECLYLLPFSESEKEHGNGRFLDLWISSQLSPEFASSDLPPKPSSLPPRLVSGGYPEAMKRSPERARQWLRQYLRSIIERDIHDVGQIKDGNDLARLIELLSHRTGTLLNVTQLANDLGHTRATIERHLAILEKLFLIRTLPAWHRNAGKRLIKTPKIHVCDSGLAATLSDLNAGQWIEERERFGHLLESFIVQQLVAQAGATQPDLRFWHYRDRDQIEVDCVITRGRKVWGVEIKAARTVTTADTKGLHRLAEISGSDFQGGIVFYDGESILPLANGAFLAMPISKLWEL
ncbi:MAG: ATP-binding protein [Akkermansiaceae bacterium]|nr:ATP-binding protein [Akkermansiaceae bacterium]